jgi:hypothetical protein
MVQALIFPAAETNSYRKVEKAQRDSRDKESAASYCRTPAAERKSRDKKLAERYRANICGKIIASAETDSKPQGRKGTT